MSLKKLWQEVDKLSERFPSDYKPILGNGQCEKPKFMIVFINPTRVNISSHPGWRGFRAPFIGTRPVWRVLHKAGLFDEKLIATINTSKDWSVGFAGQVYSFLAEKEIYLTNIVKWTGSNADLPNAEKIKAFLPLLKKEIQIVKPRYIIAMGLIPFEYLTGQKIKLKDYYFEIMQKKKLKYYDLVIDSEKYKVIPCYFPVGRGDPKKATEILRLLKTKN